MPSLPVPIFSAAVLLFLLVRLWVSQKRLTPIAVLLLLCAVQTLILTLAQHYEVAAMRYVQPVTATAIPPLAWCTFQWTAVRPRTRADLIHCLVPVTAFAALVTAPAFLDVLVPGVFAFYGVAIFVVANRGPDAQPQVPLDRDNLPTHVWRIVALALGVSALSDVIIVAAIVMGLGAIQPWIITIFSVGNLLLIGVISLSMDAQPEAIPPETSPHETTVEDREIWERIQSYMATQKPYLDPDLTLTRLARKLGVPAKKLSTIINRETGENVSRYVNAARIEAAQEALKSGENVTMAMLSCGFNTKSNFNREFLRVTGASPSDWRADVMRQTKNE